MNKRQSGILLPISSLPSNHGVGDFGKNAYEFIDLIKKSNFSIWQILPLNPLGYGNSPYQPYSSKALDSIYISLDILKSEGLIKNSKSFNKNSERVEFDKVREFKDKYLRLAYKNFCKDEAYFKFLEYSWVKDYASFISLKNKANKEIWNKWYKESEILINQELEEEIDYQIFVQFQLYKQWMKLKDYANQNNISIMGDIPFYVGLDSEEVYSNQDKFLLNRKKEPTYVAGVGPDYFSEYGQRWGNPIYNWKKLKKDNFKLLIDRLKYNSHLFDIIRLDHFRAFDTYYVIEAKYEDGRIGKWLEAPGYKFFNQLFKEVKDINIVVEDLGELRQEVITLKEHYNFKGMNILQFTLDLENKSSKTNEICYTGTHDNQSIRSYYENLTEERQIEIRKYFIKCGYNYGSVGMNFCAMCLDSNADIAIIPLIDILNSNERINTPGVMDELNWTYKIKDYQSFKKEISTLKRMNKKYKRI